jgi:hypothetical protein
MKIKGFLTVSALVVLVGCSGVPELPTQEGESLVYESQVRPDWTSKTVYEKGGSIYSVGISMPVASERSARESAYTNALSSLSKHLKSNVSQSASEEASQTGSSENKTMILENSATYKTSTDSSAIVKNSLVEDNYLQIFKDAKGVQKFKFYTLMMVKKTAVKSGEE